MFQASLSARRFTWLLFAALPLAAVAQEDSSRPPLVSPGDKYVALDIQGCADKCPSFEIVIFDSGRMTFRPNNSYSASKNTIYKNGMRSIYDRVLRYLQETGSLNEPAECTNRREGSSTATVSASDGSQQQKASWSGNCANQVERGKSIAKVFVNQTAFWRNINNDTRYWEKHWETWEYPDKAQ